MRPANGNALPLVFGSNQTTLRSQTVQSPAEGEKVFMGPLLEWFRNGGIFSRDTVLPFWAGGVFPYSQRPRVRCRFRAPSLLCSMNAKPLPGRVCASDPAGAPCVNRAA